MGQHVSTFAAGESVMTGPSLPHAESRGRIRTRGARRCRGAVVDDTTAAGAAPGRAQAPLTGAPAHTRNVHMPDFDTLVHGCW